MPGLLSDIFSYGDRLKRGIRGLLADPAGELDVRAARMAEDIAGTPYEQGQWYKARSGNVMADEDAVARHEQRMRDNAMNVALAGITALRAPSRAASKRLDRMVEQGYEDGWFHGYAAKPFDKWDPPYSVTGTPASEIAMFATRSADDASRFSKNAAAVTDEAPQVMELAIAPRKRGTIDWAKGDLPPLRSANGQRYLYGLLDDARAQGFDSVILKNADDSVAGGSSADVLAILDHGISRDKARALFDAAKKGISGLTLGSGGLGLLGALQRQQGESMSSAAPRG